MMKQHSSCNRSSSGAEPSHPTHVSLSDSDYFQGTPSEVVVKSKLDWLLAYESMQVLRRYHLTGFRNNRYPVNQ
jgi:hypothetical protein